MPFADLARYLVVLVISSVSLLCPVRAADAYLGEGKVRQVPAINGGATVEGSLHMMAGGAVTLNGGATITGDLLVPGTPVVRINGKPGYGGTLDGSGPFTPSNYTITLNGQATLRNVIRRTAPLVLPAVPPPPAPAGTRSVTLNSASQPVGAWATLRNLTLNGNVGQIAVPPGAYGDFIANGGSGFTLGISGSTTPAVYNLQRLAVNGQARIDVVGPVVLNLANGLAANGAIGSTARPEWLALNIASGGLTLNGGCSIHAFVTAPAAGTGTILINGNSTLVGGLVADKLIVNGGGLLRLRSGGGSGPVNTAPVAMSQSLSTLEDTPLSITLTATDAEGDALAYILVARPSFGTLALGDGSPLPPSGSVLPGAALRYSPASNFAGADTFSFRVRDAAALESNLATVSIAVTPVNDVPVAAPLVARTPEDTLVAITLSGQDPEGSALVYTIIAAPVNGSLTGEAPLLTYRPNPDFFGEETFTYTVTDAQGAVSAPASVTIVIDPINDRPISLAQTLELREDEPLVLTLAATDADGQSCVYSLVTLPTHGTLTLADGSPIPAPGAPLPVVSGGELRFVPGPNFNGVDVFTFTASDGVESSAPAAIQLTVLPVNDGPVAHAGEAATPEDVAAVITLSGSDIDGDALSYAITTPPAHGILTLAGHLVTYVPAADYFGEDVFAFTVADGAAISSPAVVAISVLPENDAPVALPPAGSTTPEDTALPLVLGGFDADGDALVYTIATPPAHGSLSGAAPALVYTPDADYHGPDNFAYVVTDLFGVGSAPAIVSLVVTPVNDAPVAYAASYVVAERQTLPIMLTATDADGDALTFTLISTPAAGTLSGNPPELVYTPPANTDATVEFTFVATDGAAGSAPATIRIEVRNVPDAPIAQGRTLTLAEDTALALTLTASDPDGDALGYEVLVPPAHGMLAGTPPDLVYTPDANFSGTDTLTFVARDAVLESALAVVSLIVVPVNDAPVALAQTLVVPEDTLLALILVGADADGDALEYVVTHPPAHGVLSGTAPALAYTPEADYHGSDSFTFTVTDPSGVASGPATVSIDVTPRNDPPLAASRSLSTAEDTPLALLLSGSDPDGDGLTYHVSTPPSRGVLSGDAPSFIYTPAADYHGSDTFAFVVRDGEAESSPATIAITVSPVNDAPITADHVLSLVEDHPGAIALQAVDADADALTFALRQPATDNVVTAWNAIALDAVRLDSRPVAQGGAGIAPTEISRALAIVQLAVFEALNAVDRAYAPYDSTYLEPVGPVSLETAAARAAHDALAALFPSSKPLFDSRLTQDLAAVVDFQSRDNGSALGAAAAARILALRSSDGAFGPSAYAPRPPGTPGAWQPADVSLWGTPNGGALRPEWGAVTPFVLSTAGQFDPPPPPAVDSAEYAAAYSEVKTLGASTSPVRSADQTATAYYWADGPGTYSPPGHWNAIAARVAARSNLSLVATARLLALVNLANADAAIACWRAKYAHDFWRPVTAVRYPDDTNPLTESDFVWSPLLGTPQFPSYPSGHSTFSSASATVLAGILGDAIRITVPSEDPRATTRVVNSLTAAALEAGRSRVLAGIHYEFDNVAGRELGLAVGRYVLAKALLPVAPEAAPAVQRGEASLEGATLSYAPPADYHGADVVPFSVTDGIAAAAARVLVEISPVNDVPAAAPQAVALLEDTSVQLLLTATDADGDPLAFAITTPPAHGALAGVPPALVYTPAPDYAGPDSFAFSAADNVSVSAPALVQLTVLSVNDAPFATSSAVSTPHYAAVLITLAGSDADGDVLSFALSSIPLHGTLTRADGSPLPAPGSPLPATLRYQPRYAFWGEDGLAFTASDGSLVSAPAAVTITVTPPALAVEPIVSLAPISPAPLPDTAFALRATALDADGAVARVEFYEGAALLGTLTREEPGEPGVYALLLPSGRAPGSYTFTARVFDDQGLSTTSAPLHLTLARDPRARTYTTSADFEEGQIRTLKSDGDQLTTSFFPSAYDFVWVVNSSKGTVVRLDSETARVVGEYRASPGAGSAFPSRIAIDSRGNAFVANRQTGAIVKIGLGRDNGFWVDRDGDHYIDSSTGLDDIRSWPLGGVPADEQILFVIETGLGGLEHIAVDVDDNIWVGPYSGVWRLYDGSTGQLLRSEASIPNLGGRGGFVDSDGIQVSAGPQFLRWDTALSLAANASTSFAANVRRNAWGVAKDLAGDYWVTEDWSGTVDKYSPSGAKLGSFYHGEPWAQGVTIGKDGHIWVAHSHCGYTVGHLLSDGTFLGNVRVANHGPTEVSVDRKGRVWVVSTTGVVERINPLGGPLGKDGVTPLGEVDVRSPNLGGTLWTFGNFVGNRSGLFLQDGEWRFTYDGRIVGSAWGPVQWNAFLYNNASVRVEVALSDDGVTYGAWQSLSLASSVPAGAGRYLRGRATLTPASTGESPALYDLTVGTLGYAAPEPPRYWRVSAGDDIDANWPDIVQLKGAFGHSDHAFPVQPSYQWSLVSFASLPVGTTGTAPAGGVPTFSDPTDPRSTVTFNGVGDYVLRLTATLDGIVSADDVRVHVTPFNKTPYVSAGETVYLRDAVDSVTLSGTARDDGLPLPANLTLQWEKLFGPGTVNFTAPTAAVTDAKFSTPGIYVLRLTGNDGEFSHSSTVTAWVGLVCRPVASDGIVSWWQANGDGADHVGGNQAFLENGAGYVEGRVGPAFSFDGLNDRFLVFGAPALNVGALTGAGFAFEFWIRPAESREATILQYGRDATTSGFTIRQSAQNLVVNFRDPSGLNREVSVGSALPVNTWSHLAVSYDRSIGLATIYRNGSVAGSWNYSNISIDTRNDLRVGGNWANASPFKGYLDELSVYDRSLTPPEVTRIFLADTMGKVPPTSNEAPRILANDGAGYSLWGVGRSVQFRGGVLDDDIPFGLGVNTRWTLLRAPVDAAAPSGFASAVFADPLSPTTELTVSQPGLYTVQLDAEDGAACSRVIFDVRFDMTLSAAKPAGLTAWWPLNHSSEEVIGGDLGTELAINYGEGKVGGALTGAGVEQGYIYYAKKPAYNIGAPAAGFTVEMWVRPSVGGDGNARRAVSWVEGLTPKMAVEVLDAQQLTRINLFNGVFWDVSSTAGQWTHVAWSYDRAANRMRTYRNGQLQNVQTTTAGQAFPAGGDVYFRMNPLLSSVNWYLGMMDELSIYSRPLSQQEVDAVYKAGTQGKLPLSDMNQAPVVTAGPDQFPLQAGATVTLEGQVTDDGLPRGRLDVTWTQLYGPAALIANANQAQTEVTLPASGLYGFKITATDGIFTRSDVVEARIQSMYPESPLSAARPSGLTAWWPLNHSSEEVIGGDMGTELAVSYGEGKVGGAFTGAGTQQGYIFYAGKPAYNIGASTEGFTIEMWVKPNANGDGNERRAVSWVEGQTARMALNVLDAFQVARLTLLNGTFWDVPSTAGQWTHVAWSYDRAANRMRTYRNGQLQNVQTTTAGQAFPAGGDVYFRMNPLLSSVNWYLGMMDELSIYSRPLSQQEVDAVYKAGTQGKLPLSDMNQAPVVTAGPDQFPLQAGATVTLEGQVTDDGLPRGRLDVTWTQLYGPAALIANANQAQTEVTLPASGLYGFKITATDGIFTRSDVVEARIESPLSAERPAGLAAWWPLNHSSEEVIGGDMGTELAVSYGEGKVGGAFTGAGTQQGYIHYTKKPAYNIGASAEGFTIEMWVKPNANGDGNERRAVSWVEGQTARMALNVLDAFQVARLTLLNGTFWDVPSTAGQWTHAAWSYDRAANQMRTYRNGQLHQVINVQAGLAFPAGGDVYFRMHPLLVSSNWFLGSMDELSIYSRSLSQQEVDAIYQAGAQGKLPSGSATNSAPQVQLAVSPAASGLFFGEQLTLRAFAVDREGPITSVAFYDGLALLGSVTSSTTSFQLTLPSGLPLGAHSLTAVAMDSGGLTATAGPLNVTVAYGPPTVALLEPSSGANVPSLLPISLRASASYTGGPIAKVEFFDGIIKLGESTSPDPETGHYRLNMPAGFAAGPHALTVKATAVDSATRVSTAVNITATLVVPAVALTTPVDGSSLLADRPLTLIAEANIGPGSIERVEFYRGSTLLGSASVPAVDAPGAYSLVMPTGIPAGTHVLTARAIAALSGATTTSPPVTITVAAYSGPEVVELVSPDDGARVTAPTGFTGIVARAGLASWKLEYRLTPADPAASAAVAPWTTFATGTDYVGTPAFGSAPAVPGQFGTLDPTLLLNGLYQVRLSASSTNGTTLHDFTRTLLIDGKLKLGVIDSAVVDLELPAPGFPLRIERHYSSADHSSGDFGPGTTLASSALRLQLPDILGANWFGYLVAGPLGVPLYRIDAAPPESATGVPPAPRIVAITLPDQTVLRFEADITPTQQVVPISEANLFFRPLAGTTGTLVPLDGSLAPNPEVLLSNVTGDVDLLDIVTGAPLDPAAYRLTTLDGTEYIIDSGGSLLSQRDPNGNSITYTSDAIIHSNGLRLTLTRDAFGRITRVTDPAGRQVDYTYDAAGRLLSVSDPAGQATTYGYAGGSSLVVSVQPPAAVRPTYNAFDALNRFVRRVDAMLGETKLAYDPAAQTKTLSDALGHETVYRYDLLGNVTSITDPLGHVTTYEFSDIRFPDKATHVTNHLGESVRTSYNAQGRAATVTDPLGRVTTYAYDSAGRLLTETDALGHAVTRTYDSRGNVLTVADRGGAVSRYTYDATGNPLTVTDALNNVSTFTYNSLGLPVTEAEVDSAGNVLVSRAYAYDLAGNLLTETIQQTGSDGVTRPRVTASTYDAAGRVRTITHPDGRIVTRTYTDSGLLATETTPENGLITYAYDAADRLIRVTHGDGSVELTAYDAIGRVVSRTDRGGFTTAYVYDDAGRLTTETLPDGGVITRAYDAAGRITSETDDAGRVTATAYDAAGNPVAITHPDGTATALTYDAANNVATRTVRAFAEPEFAALGNYARSIAALGGRPDAHRLAQAGGGGGSPVAPGSTPARLFRFTYDANRRLTEVVHPDGATRATLEYDFLGRPTRVVNERGAVWTYEYQGGSAMRRTRVAGSEGYVENYEYDAYANITAQIDGRGRRVETDYDVVKPVQIRFRDIGQPTFSSILNTYDSATGRLSSIRDRRSFETSFAYPTSNKTDRDITRAEGFAGAGQTHLTRERYDGRGNLVQVTDARGAVTAYEYDAFNRRTLVTHPDGVKERTVYGPGNTVSRTELVSSAGNVLATSYGYDANGRLSTVTYPDGAIEGFVFDADGRITRRTDALGHVTTYRYDDVARTVTVTDPEGGVTRHVFDSVGNLLETADARGYRTKFVYDLLGRLTRRTEAEATVVARVTTYGYDLNGNVTSMTEAAGTPLARTTSYEYDADNRLRLTTFPDGSTVRSEHDADGNLLSQTNERGFITRYDYDAFGRLTRLRDALDRATTYAYPEFGARAVRTDPLGRVFTDHFDIRQRLVSREFDGDAWVENLNYDAFGRLSERRERRAGTAPLSTARATAYAYDARGRVSTITHPSGGVERFAYDDAGNLAQVTDPRGFATAFTYDRLNRRTSETRFGAANEPARSTAFQYDPVGNLTALTRPGGQVIARVYDARNRPIELTATLSAGQTYGQSSVYDALDRIVSTDDGRGPRGFAYDLRDRLLSETDPLGHTRSSTYDPAGNRVTATDERGFTASFSYDELDRLVAANLPGGTTRAYEFDAAGRFVTEIVSGAGTAAVSSPDRATRYGYDGLDRVILTEQLAGLGGAVLSSASTAFDGEGRLLSGTDGENHTTTRVYSDGGFLASVVFPDGTSRSWTHDLAGNVLTATDELGHTTTSIYNGFGEIASVADPLGYSTTYAYDVEGRLVRVSAPLGRVTTHDYDLAGRRISTRLPDDTSLAFAYDLFGNLVARTDQADHATTYVYDALDRLLSVTAPISTSPLREAIASYSYDESGNLATITDPLGRVTRFEHDAAGRLSATFLPLRPENAHERRAYDHSGNLVDLTDGNGHLTHHAYDARGLLRSVRPDGAFGQPEIRHDYDGRGLRTSMADRLGVTSYAYDTRGRPIAKSTPYAGALSYGYDAAGRLTSLTSSASDGVRMAYGYDDADRLISATDTRTAPAAVTSYAYDAANRLVAKTLPSGLVARHGYDAMDRLLSVVARAGDSPSAAVVESYTYTRTLTGQLASEMAVDGRAETYAYDHSDRLVRQIVSGDASGQNGTLDYTLDAIGNRLARASTIPGLPSQDFHYDENHAIEGYAYDDQGNPVSGVPAGQAGGLTAPAADSYDFRHALVAREAQVTYLYDGDGERVGRRVWNPVAKAWDDTFYLNDSLPSAANPLGLSQTLEERAPGGALQRRYSPAPQRLAVAEHHVLASSGGAFSVALAADGTVLAWGDNSAGQLGDGSAVSARATPEPVPGLTNITRVVAGSEFAAALRADGTLFWWGRLGDSAQAAPAALVGLPPLRSVVAGADFLVALASDGTVWTFGDNSAGQLGSGDFVPSAAPAAVSGLSGVVEVAAGAVHALALDVGGHVHAWGGNTAGQLGSPAYTALASTLPLAVPGLADVVELSGGARHTLALDLDGVVYAWGDNASGQLGDGTRATRAVVQPVSGLAQAAVSIAAGGWHSVAALADGTVRAWGSHTEGQAASVLATADDQLTPAAVAGLSGVARVAAGARQSFALTAAGQWYGWGSNREGQLGLDGTVGGSTPVALASPGLVDVVGGHDAAPAIAVAQGTRYYGYDAQGSVRYQTDAAGSVTARYDYDAFGTLLGASGESPVGSDAYLYRGERYDALTGLYHLRSRDYDPALGRFHQIDDFAGFPNNPYSLNRYNYAESNPVGNFDPAGRFAVTSLVSAVYALHIKDQYLAELASAGPQFTFDPDEALNRYSMTDYLVAAGAPLKLKERELWVRASGGGLLGSWVNESGSSQETETQAGRGFGAGSDVFFLHQSGARFRQGWALRQVEQAWGALQQSRLSLNMGPRFPDDPRSGRIAAGNVRLKGTRWADAIYADALLQATLRSATEEGRRGVRAHFTPTVEGRRYDATGVDLTARATSALNAAGGGGPVDWEEPVPPGADRFQAASSVGALESPVTDEFLKAISLESIRDNWLRSASASPYAASSARAYLLAQESGGNVLAGLASAYVTGTPWVGMIAQDSYQGVTGKDFMSGENLSAGGRLWSLTSVALELVPGFAHVVGDGIGHVIGASARGAKATKAVLVRAGGSSLSIAGEAARRGLMHAQVANSAARAGAGRFAEGFGHAYAASRRAQLARLAADPLLGLGTEAGHFAEGVSGGVKKLFRETDEAVAAAAHAPVSSASEFIGPMDLIGPRLAAENASGRFGGVVGSNAAERSFLDNARATFGEGSVFSRATRHRDNIVIQRSDIPISIENLRQMKGGNSPFVKNNLGEWEALNLHHIGRQDGKLIEILSSHNAYDSVTGGMLHIPGPGGPLRQSRLSQTYWQQRLEELIGSGQVPDAMLRQLGR